MWSVQSSFPIFPVVFFDLVMILLFSDALSTSRLLRDQLLNCLQVGAPAIAVFVVYTGNGRGGK
jgi:hypothetical protein